MEDGYTFSKGVREHQNRCETETENTETKKTQTQSNGSIGHKRSLSGSIISKTSIQRIPQTEVQTLGLSEEPDEETKSDILLSKASVNAIAGVMQERKNTRRRKGSLRKTALLGTGKLRLEGRERSSAASRLYQENTSENTEHNYNSEYGDHVQIHPASPQKFNPPDFSYIPTTDVPLGKSAFAGHTLPSSSEDGLPLFGSPVTSPTLGDASTTDEDEMITIPRHNINGLAATQMLRKPSSSGSDSYFPPQLDSVEHRRSNNKSKSPLGVLVSGPTESPEVWDYSATEWWGWVVLLVTWIVFVVGMGSCFEVWSWAWDVGETPYAPPELEDDPTLPIVGYYPALTILTAVMAWVWVVIAWVGMKYFKHAKISGEGV